MVWKIEYSATADRRLRKLDRQHSARIVDFLRERVVTDDPRKLGQALVGAKSSYWRYHVGNYRVICDIQDDRVVVLIVDVGHRRDVYR